MTGKRKASAHDPLAGFETIPDVLRSLVETRSGVEALVLIDRRAGEQSVTLAELWEKAQIFQATLMERGLQPGSVVVLVLPTSPELISAWLGAVLAGGIPSMLSTPSHRVANPRIFLDRVAHVVADSHPHSLICQPEVAALFEGKAAEVLGSTRILTPDECGSAPASGVFPDPHVAAGEDVVTIQYSSGTTGAPKGVLISHRATLNNLRSMRLAFAVQDDDVSVNWIPLYHDMGLFGGFLLPLLCGCKTVLIPTMDFMRDPVVWLRAIHDYGGSFSWAPNLAYALCATRPSDEALEGLDLSSWRLALNGSEPVLAPTVRAFAARMAPYGFPPEAMSPAYGLAEVTALATVQPIDEEPRCEVLDRELLATQELAEPTAGDGVSCVSVGPAIPGCKIEVRDPEGNPLPDRRVGKVWLQSDAAFSGYHADPDRTRQAVSEGWLNTGDRGYLDGGYLFFVARDKDLIIVGGEKYVPDDIEAVINRVPGVRQGCAAAIGIVSEERGTEEVAAVVETYEEGEEALEDLRRRIRIEVTDVTGLGLAHVILTPPGGIEKSTSGKIARDPTRLRYAKELGIAS